MTVHLIDGIRRNVDNFNQEAIYHDIFVLFSFLHTPISPIVGSSPSKETG